MKLDKKIKQANDLLNSGNMADAEKLFRQVLKANPKELCSLFALGIITMKGDDPLRALDYFDRVTKSSPNFDKAWFNRGVVLYALKRHEDAIASYDRAIKINPSYVEAFNNRGVVMQEIGLCEAAVKNYDQLLNVIPDYDKALANKGFILALMCRYEEAIACFTRLLEVNPDYNFALGLLSSAQQYACKWDDYERVARLIHEGLKDGKRVIKTLVLMAISDVASDHLLCAQSFASLICPPSPVKIWKGEIYSHPKIRVAYISPDFREHPVAHLLVGVLEQHDKSRFETYGFFLGESDNSNMHRRIAGAFDRFIDVRQKGSREIAEMIRALEIDIVVDLAGYTQDSRTDVLAYRPAPVQVNYLGHPGTLGVEYIDYILADRTVIPEADQNCYTEKVVYLPGSYLPADPMVKVAERTPEREEFGLPATGFVFCSFNHAYKISPKIFDVWMRILKRTPGSVLWLMKLNSTAEPNLRKEAEARGVDPARLIFATRVPKVEDHLARYRLADIFLDTTPYNAHTTACDALFVGLPVLTYLGKAFPARVAASLLNTIGLPELIADSLADYEELAVQLAQNPEKLAGLKKKLQVNISSAPLYDSARFSRKLEAAYTIMWERYQQGLAPTAIEELAPAEASSPAAQDDQIPVKPQFETATIVQSDQQLIMAQELLRQGNLPQAEIYLRQCLAGDSNNSSAVTLLADLRRGYGFSASFELSENAPVAYDQSTRYLLIKAWGYGFWSEAHHLATQLLLAELTRRTPIILWGSNCLFRNESDINAFSRFFQEIPSAQLDDVPKTATIYPPKWQWSNIYEENVNKWEGNDSRLAAQYMFDRPESLVVSDFFSTACSIIPWIGPSSKYFGLSENELYAALFQKYLKPVAAIVSKGDDFYSRTMQGRNWVGVHVRGSDKIHESPQLARTNANYFVFLDRIIELNPTIGLFLLTDSQQVMDEFRNRYGERLLSTDASRSASNVGVHLSGHDGPAIGEEVLLDVLLALKCDYFVGNQESNVSLAVASMRNWTPGFIFLLGEKSIRSENLFLHKREYDSSPQNRQCSLNNNSSPVRIAIDGVFFRFASGIPRLWKSLLSEWSANGFGEHLVVIDRAKTAPRFAGITYIDAPQHNYTNLQADRKLLQEICDREKISLFTSTYYTTPLTTQSVLMVPDMIPEVMGFDLNNVQWQEKHHAIEYCQNYLTISNSTANDLIRFFPAISPDQVITAYCGTSFNTPPADQVNDFKQRHGIDRPYFLISGSKSDYKNAILFFRAFALFGEQRSGYSIVCTHSLPPLEPEFQACVDTAKVHLLVLSDNDLQCAYAGAVALAYPSRYEGFGLPVLEAMACSCPVITCNNSSIGEVAGDAALYVGSDDVDAMRAALTDVQDGETRRDLIEKGLRRAEKFTWRMMADQVQDALTRWAIGR